MTCKEWNFILVGQDGLSGAEALSDSDNTTDQKNKALPNCGSGLFC